VATRTKARRRALEVLFEADLRDMDPTRVLADRIARVERQTPQDTEPAIGEYTIELVNGVLDHIDRIDSLIQTYSIGWKLDRLPAVDRNLLRIGLFELYWADDVPDVVVINEAVSLAQELSTQDSPQFVNGILNRLMELKPTLQR
jgi:transcription antitermination protein NusB